MAKLYSISIYPVVSQAIDPATVEYSLNLIGDWIRFSPWQWFILSNSDKQEIANAVQQRLKPGDQIVVVVVAPEYAQGYANNWIWTWLNDRMQKVHLGL